ncbi:MAG: hypothetical protein AAFV37_04880 [Pseudomonadota bacterium]
MPWKLFLIAAACVGGLSFAAHADALNACKGTSNTCKTVHIVNGSFATVVGVDVRETRRNGNAGCRYKTWHIKRNLAGLGGRYDVQLNPDCRYEIKFYVTDDCSGNKKGQLTSKELKDGTNRFRLRGGCGSLKTGKRTGSESKSAASDSSR